MGCVAQMPPLFIMNGTTKYVCRNVIVRNCQSFPLQDWMEDTKNPFAGNPYSGDISGLKVGFRNMISLKSMGSTNLFNRVRHSIVNSSSALKFDKNEKETLHTAGKIRQWEIHVHDEQSSTNKKSTKNLSFIRFTNENGRTKGDTHLLTFMPINIKVLKSPKTNWR